jgi:hypothetical protein
MIIQVRPCKKFRGARVCVSQMNESDEAELQRLFEERDEELEQIQRRS